MNGGNAIDRFDRDNNKSDTLLDEMILIFKCIFYIDYLNYILDKILWCDISCITEIH